MWISNFNKVFEYDLLFIWPPWHFCMTVFSTSSIFFLFLYLTLYLPGMLLDCFNFWQIKEDYFVANNFVSLLVAYRTAQNFGGRKLWWIQKCEIIGG